MKSKKRTVPDRPRGESVRVWEQGRVRLKVCSDAEDLAHEAVAIFISSAKEAIASRGRFDALLSGGSTPKRTFELLAAEGQFLDWPRIHLFWTDERMAPPGSAESNYGMAHRKLLSRVPVPAANVHRIRGELADAREAARSYEEEMRRHFGNTGKYPSFDLVFLGLGPEGHTASLFPDSADELSGPGWVFAPWIGKLGQFRVSVSLGVLNAAKEVVFLVSGSEKAEILRKVFSPTEHKALLPAQRVHPAEGRSIWLVDRPAARWIE